MSEEENTDTVGSLKIRVANMLLNTVALSESLNIIRDVCVNRAAEIVDNASTEDLEKIKTQVDNYEEAQKQQQEANDQAAAADPAQPIRLAVLVALAILLGLAAQRVTLWEQEVLAAAFNALDII